MRGQSLSLHWPHLGFRSQFCGLGVKGCSVHLSYFFGLPNLCPPMSVSIVFFLSLGKFLLFSIFQSYLSWILLFLNFSSFKFGRSNHQPGLLSPSIATLFCFIYLSIPDYYVSYPYPLLHYFVSVLFFDHYEGQCFPQGKIYLVTRVCSCFLFIFFCRDSGTAMQFIAHWVMISRISIHYGDQPSNI